MSAPVWTIGLLGGPMYSLADLNIPSLKRTCKSQARDTVTFEVAMPGDATQFANGAAVFAYKQIVVVKKNGVQWFYGPLTKPKGKLNGKAESQEFEISSPWWYLEQTVMQQEWANANGTTTQRSRLILGEAMDGTRLTTGQELAEILEWALTCGASFQVGTVAGGQVTAAGNGAVPYGVEMPFSEVVDRMCSECIKQVLRWVPDTVSWFDYSTTPPTLYFQRRAALTAVTLPMVSLIAESLEIEPRYDIQVPAVIINYEITGSVNGAPYTALQVDPWPLSSYWLDGVPNGQTVVPPIGAIINTVGLSGTSTTFQTQPIKTEALPPLGAADATVVAFFYRHCGDLRKMLQANLKYVSSSYYSDLEPGQTAPDGSYLPAWDVGDLPNVLVSGSITPWMQAQNPNLHAAYMDLHAAFTYQGSPSPGSDEQIYADQYFGPGAAEGPTTYMKWLHLKVLATNAQTETYAQLTGISTGESVPVGVAQALYEVLNVLHYQGSMRLVEVEVSGAVGVGNALNISGGKDEWQTMAACVQSIEEVIATGQTTITVGPPEHLTPQNTIELLRANRTRTASEKIVERQTAQPGNSVQGAGLTPIKSPTGSPSYLPWLGASETQGSSGNNLWSLWFGDSGASFVNKAPEAIKQLGIEVDADNNDFLTLTFGDATDDNCGLWFGNDDSEFGFFWRDNAFQFTLKDTSGDNDQTISLNINNGPQLSLDDGADNTLLADVNDNTPSLELKDSEGNDIAATIDSGVPSLTVADDGSASVKLDVSDGDPEVYVYDGTASVQLIIKTGPGVYLDDGSGSTISLDIESDAELVITDGTNTSTLTAGDLTLDGGGTIECNGDGCEITVADDSGNSTDITAGDITLDDNGEFCVGDSTLKDGDLNLGDSGTIECGSSGSVSVGDSTLASGSLALGSSGDLSCSSIECDTISTTGDVSVGGNLDCASLSIGGTDIDTYIQDVVNQMTWTATCSEDGTSITISAS